MQRALASGLAVLSVVFGGLLGCDTSGPNVSYVEGVVTLDGQPIEGVSVGFSPVEGGSGTPAVGTTDANGEFKLTSIQGGSDQGGAVPGEYNVTFTKSAVQTMSLEEMKRGSEDPNYGQQDSSAVAQRQLPKNESPIPTKYAAPNTSGFKVTVKPGTNKGDEFKFDLKSSE